MDKKITKRYTKDELTVIWQPHKCIHSTVCFNGLPQVFDPRVRPWVNMDGADQEKIIEQVKQCPSGALSYELKSQAAENTPAKDSGTRIDISPDGPILVHGTVTIKNSDGKISRQEKVTALCRCGASENKPFCDGTHTKINFKG